MKALLKTTFILLTSLLFSSLASASGGGNEPAEGINYIPVTPALIVNYGGPGRVRFIKAELSIRTETGEDAKEIMHHLPIIRDTLINILSAQTEESVNSPDGKEALRLQALAEINKAVHRAEYGPQPEEVAHKADDKKDAHGAKKDSHEVKKDSHEPKKDAHSPKADGHDKPSAEPAEAEGEAHHPGPASDLFFNNFIVQK